MFTCRSPRSTTRATLGQQDDNGSLAAGDWHDGDRIGAAPVSPPADEQDVAALPGAVTPDVSGTGRAAGLHAGGSHRQVGTRR